MNKNFILEEQEMSIMANSISNTAESLLETISEYQAILNAVTKNGIKDNAICQSLENIIAEAESYKKGLTAINDNLSIIVRNDLIKAVESHDTMDFDYQIMTAVKSYLSRFK